MSAPQLEIEIVLDDGTVKKAMGTIKKESKKTGKESGGELGEGMSAGLMGKIGGMKVAIAAIGAAFVALSSKAVQAANEQERAINDLNTSLKLSGEYTLQSSLDFQKFASSLQESSVVGDEVILKNAALIQNLGNLSNDGLKQATQAALDLSAALNIDLAAASTLIGKAAAGEVSSFSRYGLIIKKAATANETFARTIEAVNSKFGGAAKSKVNDYQGATQQLSNSWGDLWENLGFFITKSEFAQNNLKRLKSAVDGLNETLAVPQLTLKEQLAEQVKALSEIDGKLKSTEKLKGSVGKYLVGMFGGSVDDIDDKKQLILAKILELENQIATDEVATQEKLKAKAEANRLASIEKEKEHNKKLIENLAQFGIVTLSQLNENETRASAQLKEAFNRKLISQQEYETQLLRIKENFAQQRAELSTQEQDQEKGLLDSFLGGLRDSEASRQLDAITDKTQKAQMAMKIAAKDMSQSMQSLGKAAQTGLGQGMASGFSAFGAALVNGENALEAFGKAMLGSLGQAAISEGTSMILRGTGYLFDPFMMGFAPGLISAGAALAAFGGAISAVSGASTSSVANSNGGGLADTNGAASFSTASTVEQTEERQEAPAQVNINIDRYLGGSDKQQFAKDIADLLGEAASESGIRVSA